MTGIMPTMPRATRRRARRSPTGSASRGSSGRRTSGISGRSRITSASAAPSWAARPPGCRRASRSGSPKSAVRRSTRAPTSRACFPIRSRRNPGLPYFSNGKRDDSDPAPLSRSGARRVRSGLRRRRAQSGVAGLWRPHDCARRASICGPGTRGLIRCFRRRPMSGATAPNWETGHWLTGRLGGAPLDALVAALLDDSGVTDVDTSELGEGRTAMWSTGRCRRAPCSIRWRWALPSTRSSRTACCAFASAAARRWPSSKKTIWCCRTTRAPARLTRAQESDLPREVSIGFTDLGTDYQRAAAASRRLVGRSTRNAHADLAMVSNDAETERRAEIWLQDLWAGRESADFALPPSQLALVRRRRRRPDRERTAAADRAAGDVRHREPRDQGALDRSGSVQSAAGAAATRRAPAVPPALGPVHALVLDLPTLTSEQPPVLARLAVFADPWPGAEVIWSSGDGASFSRAGPGAGAGDRRRDARRSAGRADRALARRQLPRAALRRRAGVGVATLRCSPAPMSRRCSAPTAPGR